MPSTGAAKSRKPRPSRARGLRTTTGCLTCRKRRVKCDEGKPRCATCVKSERECLYATDSAADPAPSRSVSANASTPSVKEDETRSTQSPAVIRKILAGDVDPRLCTNSPALSFDSPLTNIPSFPSPNSAPLEWYDLLAEDAINNIDKYNLNLDLERTTLSSRQSPDPDAAYEEAQSQGLRQEQEHATVVCEQWNSPDSIPLTGDELMLFQHYIDVIGPMFDLTDATKQFSTTVPHLAVHNVGLLKSLLAVAARHLALADTPVYPMERAMPTASTSSSAINPMLQVATHYYYESLQYLSQNLLYPSYSLSQEIISTSILISTYVRALLANIDSMADANLILLQEMFDAEGLYSNGAWERHLRGIFWIQRSQNNNGECEDPLRRAAWWQWLRQDTWVAFREGRRVLTIWRPTRRLKDLSPDELCLRIMYIAARCVDFVANDKKCDVAERIGQGHKLLQALADWNNALPSSFRPLYKAVVPPSGHLFAPIWVHPPAYASALLQSHFARIVVIMNQPTIGGISDFHERQSLLDESVDVICGMAVMHQSKRMAIMTSDFQPLYAAGLCTQDPNRQTAILRLLEASVDISRFPQRAVVESLVSYWRGRS